MLQFKTQCVLNIYIFMYLHTYIFIATDGGHVDTCRKKSGGLFPGLLTIPWRRRRVLGTGCFQLQSNLHSLTKYTYCFNFIFNVSRGLSGSWNYGPPVFLLPLLCFVLLP